MVSSPRQDLFPVEMTSGPDGPRGTFYLQEPGDYRVRAVVRSTDSEAASLAFHVAEQRFLSFPSEFGLFGLTLLIAAGGLVLWFRNRKKAGSSSASSPC